MLVWQLILSSSHSSFGGHPHCSQYCRTGGHPHCSQYCRTGGHPHYSQYYTVGLEIFTVEMDELQKRFQFYRQCALIGIPTCIYSHRTATISTPSWDTAIGEELRCKYNRATAGRWLSRWSVDIWAAWTSSFPPSPSETSSQEATCSFVPRPPSFIRRPRQVKRMAWYRKSHDLTSS